MNSSENFWAWLSPLFCRVWFNASHQSAPGTKPSTSRRIRNSFSLFPKDRIVFQTTKQRKVFSRIQNGGKICTLDELIKYLLKFFPKKRLRDEMKSFNCNPDFWNRNDWWRLKVFFGNKLDQVHILVLSKSEIFSFEKEVKVPTEKFHRPVHECPI